MSLAAPPIRVALPSRHRASRCRAAAEVVIAAAPVVHLEAGADKLSPALRAGVGSATRRGIEDLPAPALIEVSLRYDCRPSRPPRAAVGQPVMRTWLVIVVVVWTGIRPPIVPRVEDLRAHAATGGRALLLPSIHATTNAVASAARGSTVFASWC